MQRQSQDSAPAAVNRGCGLPPSLCIPARLSRFAARALTRPISRAINHPQSCPRTLFGPCSIAGNASRSRGVKSLEKPWASGLPRSSRKWCGKKICGRRCLQVLCCFRYANRTKRLNVARSRLGDVKDFAQAAGQTSLASAHYRAERSPRRRFGSRNGSALAVCARAATNSAGGVLSP